MEIEVFTSLKLRRWRQKGRVIIAILVLTQATAACVDGGDATPSTTVPATTMASGDDTEPVTLVAESLTVVSPRGWDGDVHEDGGGVFMRSPSATLNITLIPSAFFEGIFLELPEELTAQALAEIVAPILGAIEGVEQSPPEIVELAADRTVMIIATHAADLDGEVVFVPAGPGVVAVASLTAERGAIDDARVASRLVIAAMRITTTSDDLLAALTASSNG